MHVKIASMIISMIESHSLFSQVLYHCQWKSVAVDRERATVECYGMKTIHEEDNLIMEQKHQYAHVQGTSTVSVISIDTYIFLLLAYFHWNLHLKSGIFLEATGNDCKLIGIANTWSKICEHCSKSCSSS